MNEVPIDEPCVISKYVENPYLINGKKFEYVKWIEHPASENSWIEA